MPADVPVYSAALLGYRVLVLSADGALSSTGDGAMRWRPGTNVAYCAAGGGHDAPAAGCGCGLYALHRVRDAAVEAGQLRRSSRGQVMPVIAAVAARGHVELHATGFRASDMTIIALLAPPQVPARPTNVSQQRPAAFQTAADRYQVPVAATSDQLVRMSRQVAQPAPGDLTDRLREQLVSRQLLSQLQDERRVMTIARVASVLAGLAAAGCAAAGAQTDTGWLLMAAVACAAAFMTARLVLHESRRQHQRLRRQLDRRRRPPTHNRASRVG